MRRGEGRTFMITRQTDNQTPKLCHSSWSIDMFLKQSRLTRMQLFSLLSAMKPKIPSRAHIQFIQLRPNTPMIFSVTPSTCPRAQSRLVQPRQKGLLYRIQDPEISRVEISTEVLGIQFPCFAICFIEDVAACVTKCCGCAGMKEVLQAVGLVATFMWRGKWKRGFVNGWVGRVW